MAWPGLNDLQEALQDPARAFKDQTLSRGRVAQNRLGLPLSWIGNFAAVFQVVVNGNPYAVRCFTHNPLGKQNRYEAIDHHLKTNGRPATFVDFNYQETGLICRGQEYPLIKMPWINGQTLDEFTYENIGKADVLEQLAREWYQAATELQQLPIAHNDLQHGNVMVEQGSRASIKLVDYDGLYVPQFANQESPENGHRHYQHPARDQRYYGPQVDNFPALVIYTSLIALARDPGTSARRATPESLLFAQTDLQEPQNSKLFQYLEQSQDQQTAQLARALSDSAKGRVEDTPTLEQANAQVAKKALPSWLTQPPLPNTAPWTAPGTVAPPVTAYQPARQQTAGTPRTSQDPAQQNRNLIDEQLQGIGREIKPAVIRYAKQMQQTGWTFQSVKGVTGTYIRSIKDLENSGPDATALGAVLRAILDHRRDDPLSNIGMSNTHISRMQKIRHDHAHSLVDFSDQHNVDGALKTLKDFRQSINNLPPTLPRIQHSPQGRSPQYGNQGRSPKPGNQGSGQSNQGKPSTQPRKRYQTQQQRPRTQTVPTYRATSVLDRLVAQCFLLSTVFSFGMITLIATHRIVLEDLSIVLVGVVVMISSGFWLWKINEDPAELVGEELKNAGTFVAKAVKSAFQATGRIPNQKTKWTVRIAPVVVLAGVGIYLFTPPGYFGLPALDGTPIAQPKPQTTQETKSSLPTRVVEASPQMVTAPATSNHGILPGTCTQTEVGNTVCIGNAEGQPEPQPHLPDDSPMLRSNNCLTVGDENICWNWIQETPAGIQFLDIQKGGSHACGIKTDQTIICWGANASSRLDSPPGEFLSLTTGLTHSCALRNNGTAECWGDNTFDQLAAPTNQFKEISAGSTSTCGIDYDNALVCWGNESDNRFAPIGTTELTTVSSGYSHACGIKNDGTPICWGGYKPENNIAPSVKLVSINAGSQNTCGIMTDGNAVCWGKNEYGETEVPPGQFTDIQTDGSRTCGLRPNGSIECWGWAIDQNNSRRTPPGPYRTFRINGATCGIRFDDTASCWSTQHFTTEAKTQPTSTLDQTTYYVELFASCNGRYSGETKERRRAAAQSTLTQGLRTLSEIIDIVAEKCQ